MLLKAEKGVGPHGISAARWLFCIVLLIGLFYISDISLEKSEKVAKARYQLIEKVVQDNSRVALQETDSVISAEQPELSERLDKLKPGQLMLLIKSGKQKDQGEVPVLLSSLKSRLFQPESSSAYFAVLGRDRLIYEKGAKPGRDIAVDLSGKRFQRRTKLKIDVPILVKVPAEGSKSKSAVIVNQVEYLSEQQGWFGLILDEQLRLLNSFYLDQPDEINQPEEKVQEPENPAIEELASLGISDFSSDQQPMELELDIKPEPLSRIKAKREEALERGILFASSEDYVPAKITYNQKSTPVKIRLKGDWTDHLRFDRWSFRVKTSGQRTILGMKTFSLQDPLTRGFLFTWLFHKAWEKEGGIAPRYYFVKLTLNGEPHGTYVIEEHFEKRMLENRDRREAPILKFDESSLWQHYDVFKRGLSLAWKGAPVTAFKENRTLSAETLKANFLNGYSLMDGFRSEELKTSEVFELDTIAKYVALNDLFGSYHGLAWHNVRMYFDPFLARLEPISFDVVGTLAKNIAYRTGDSSFLGKLFKDPAMVRPYFKHLERFSRPEYLESLFKELAAELVDNTALILENRSYFKPNLKRYLERADFVRSVLELDPLLTARYAGVLENDESKSVSELLLNAAVLHPLPVQILKIEYEGREVELAEPARWITPKTGKATAEGYKLKLSRPISLSPKKLEQLKLFYQVPGTSAVKYISLPRYAIPSMPASESLILRENDLFRSHPAFKIDEELKQIVVKPGEWTIDQQLVFPKGYRLIARAGTEIDIVKGASIVSYSPLEFEGREDAVIKIHSSDKTGQGLVILNTDNSRSSLRYVHFDSLSNLTSQASTLTGAVTIYKSDIDIENCLFSNNQSEDALNLVRSRFSISRSAITQTTGDALDIDFGKGKISEFNLSRVGNDALDFSGSEISLDNIEVNGCGDKGVSVGEDSKVKASAISVRACQIGVASKDKSLLSVDDISIQDTTILAAAYQKKPEYGPAEIQISRLRKLSLPSLPYLVETNSKIFVDRKLVKTKKKKQEQFILKRLKQGISLG